MFFSKFFKKERNQYQNTKVYTDCYLLAIYQLLPTYLGGSFSWCSQKRSQGN